MSGQDHDDAPETEVSFNRRQRTRRARRALRVPVDEVPRAAVAEEPAADGGGGSSRPPATDGAAAPADVPPPPAVPGQSEPAASDSSPSSHPPPRASSSPPPAHSSSAPPPSGSYPPPAGEGVVMSGTVRVSTPPPAAPDEDDDEPEISIEAADEDELDIDVEDEDLAGEPTVPGSSPAVEPAAASEAEAGAEPAVDDDEPVLELEEAPELEEEHPDDDEPELEVQQAEEADEPELELESEEAEELEPERQDAAEADTDETPALELDEERAPERAAEAGEPLAAQQAGTEPAAEPEDEAEHLDLDEVEAEEAAEEAPPAPPPVPEDAAEPVRPPEPPAESGEAEAQQAEAPPVPRRKKRKPWYEEFFNDDYLRTVPEPPQWYVAKQCDFIERALGLEKGATILDVGCGLGLHAVELASRGYLVVGLDLSLPMLSRASDEAQDRGLKINFLHADMREMSFDGAFDAVLCWGTTLGYFDDETNRDVIQRMYRALKPMGLLLLDVVNRDYVVPSQPNLVWFEGDGCVCMEETQLNYILSRLAVKRTVILDDGRQRESHYSIRLYGLHELGGILHQQGFRVAQVSGMEATPGVFFGQSSPRMIILAERRLQPGETSSTPPAQGASPEGGAPAREASDASSDGGAEGAEGASAEADDAEAKGASSTDEEDDDVEPLEPDALEAADDDEGEER